MTDRDRFRRAETLFLAASRLEPEERAAYLDDACGDDEALKADVLAMLARDEGPTGVLDRPALGPPGSAGVAGLIPPPAATPERIDRYQIIRPLGHGGMGVVYEARQESPRRTVALKVIKAGATSTAALRRFEHESQVLARLQHPGIAQIYDAGTFDAGAGAQPYFAMELIQGEPLTRHADRAALGTRPRLALVARIADAVQHAHQRGVIHRDLKPANILVDESGQPKVLDFGIARATDSDVQATTIRTDIGQLIGTVPYMSPEQAAGDPAALDTRSDVYALGVLTYELITGRLPHDVQHKMVHEAVRMIREDEPTPLSSIDRVFSGDVETIVGKALEKDKTRRYATAAAFADDIRRYLDDEPIAARPPSTLYQLRKFARRNRILVGGVAAVFVVLVAGVLVATALAVSMARAQAAEAEQRTRAQDAEREAQAAAAEARDQATRAEASATRARTETATARQVSDFLIGLFKTSTPDVALGETLTARQILDDGARDVRTRLRDQPVIQARLMTAIGTAYHELGLVDSAAPLLTDALALRRTHLTAGDPDLAESLLQLSILEVDRGNHDRAVTLATEGVTLLVGAHGLEHRDVAEAKHNLAHALFARGEYDAARTRYEQAIAIYEREPDAPPGVHTASLSGLAQVEHFAGDLDRAETLFREALARRRQEYGAEHPDIAQLLHNLAAVLHDRQQLDEAETRYREALAMTRHFLGDEHSEVADTLVNLGRLLRDRGDLAGAEAVLQETLALDRRIYGASHENVAYDLKELANLQSRQGRTDEAEATYRQSLAMYRVTVPPDHPYLAVVLRSLGTLLANTGSLDEAESMLREAFTIAEASLAADHWLTLIARMELGACLGRMGRYAEGEPHLLESHAAFVATVGADDPRTVRSVRRIVELYERWGRTDATDAWRDRLPPADGG